METAVETAVPTVVTEDDTTLVETVAVDYLRQMQLQQQLKEL